MARKKNTAISIMFGLIATAVILLLGGARAHAQLWQVTFGYGAGNDAARGGVVALPNNGGMVFAGQSRRADEDIYVTRTDACYQVAWGFAYNIGGDDVARRIRQTADGGFIVVGTTYNTNACGTHNDIFLLRLDANGAVLWARTYGGSDIEEGRDVQVAADGGFVVAGFTRSYGAGNNDALLMKTNAAGVPLWTRVYGGTADDYFMGCAIAANGEVLAVGATRSFTVGGNSDIFLTRVAQATGVPVGGFPYHYGGNDYELGWKVLDCANGDIAVCGNTRSVGGNSEGYLLRTTNAGVLRCDRAYGGYDGAGWDEFLDFREIENGTFITTGLFYNAPGGWGNYDVYTSNVDPCFDPLSETLHGGAGDDQGWAVVRAAGAPEYYIVGLTTSYGFGGEDVYAIRQLVSGISNCLDRTPVTSIAFPNYPRLAAPAANTAIAIPNCVVPAPAVWVEGWTMLCSTCNPSSVVPEGSFLTNTGVRPDDGRRFVTVDSSATAASSVELEASESGVGLYPNPIHGGDALAMRFPSTGVADVTVTISDIAGKVLREERQRSTEGAVTIATDGWASGTYLVQVREGSRSYTRRVVVTDR